MFNIDKKLLACIILLETIGANAITISEAVKFAVDKHPLIEIAKQEVAIKSKSIDIAKGAFYPKVNLSVNYGDEVKKSRQNNASSYTKEDLNGGYNAQVSLTQNIFNGYSDSAKVAESKAALLTSKFAKESSIDKLTFDVVNTYLEIVRLREVLKYEKKSIKKFEDYYTLASKKSKVTGQKSETYTVNSKLLKTKSAYIRHKWDLKKQNEKYLQLVGIQPDASMRLDLLTSIQKRSMSDFLNSLVSKNSDLQQYISKMKENRALQKEARAQYLPKLDFELKSYEDEDLESFQTKTKQTSAMFTLKYNLFNGGIDKNKIEKIKVAKLKLQAEYEKKNLEQIQTIRIQYELYLTSKEQVKTLMEYVSVQNELTYLYQEEFKLGKRTIINLVDSQQDLKNARINYVNSFIGMVRSSYAVVYAVGGLNSALEKINFKQLNLFEKVAEKNIKHKRFTKKLNKHFPSKVKSIKKASYTLSIATFSKIANAQEFVKKYFSNFKNTKIFKIKGTSFVKVISGEFLSNSEAKKSLTKIPSFLVKNNDITVEKIQKYKKHLS